MLRMMPFQDQPPDRLRDFHDARVAEKFFQVGAHRLWRGRSVCEIDQQDAGLGGRAVGVGGFGLVAHIFVSLVKARCQAGRAVTSTIGITRS